MGAHQSLNEERISFIERQVKLLGKFEVDAVIVGGVAATLHGSETPTSDLDVCYSRDFSNLERLAKALQSVNARLRNAPENLPFILDAETLKRGLNFTLSTEVGSLDLLGEVRGVGSYEEVLPGALIFEMFGYQFPVVELPKLILAKRTAGRPKDMIAVVELEALLAQQTNLDQS
jgi:hypothetical protein